MNKRLATEDITENGLLSSYYGDISEYMPSKTHAEIQGTNEVELYASYVKVLPVTGKGQISQNVLMLNVYVITRPSISDSKEYSLERFIADKISVFTDVDYIIISKEESNFHVWTVMNKLDRTVRDKIYDIEYDILQHFSDIYFDFHVISMDDRDINDLFPSNAIIIYRKR